MTCVFFFLTQTPLPGVFWLFWVFKKYVFIYLSALGLSCGMWDLVPQPGIKPGPPALGVWSQPLDHQGSPWLLCFNDIFPDYKSVFTHSL